MGYTRTKVDGKGVCDEDVFRGPRRVSVGEGSVTVEVEWTGEPGSG